MATLVLTTVGSAFGPIGGAIGAVIGSRIDRRVLAPKGRRGPRLGDLAVQTSSYGSQLPRLFGTMRVAGTVIWATDLREDAHSSGGGKSGSRTTSYSYSASFAVALSARPIAGVGRIWADGKLLRGSAGDWKSETGFRLYLGSEDQAPDPLIAAAEGIGATPAYRGLAYAVFENMQLADYANRIPSLTFEVTAEAAAVAVSAIAAELSGGAIAGAGGPTLGGYAASGDSVRGALETLAQAFPMALADDGETLRLNPANVLSLGPEALGSDGGGVRQPARVRERGSAGGCPDAITLAHYEPARDYQAGLQQARRDGIGRSAARIDLPAAIEAPAAKALAEQALARTWRERERAVARLPWRMLGAKAGTLASLDDGSVWRIGGWSLERMVIELRLTRASGGTALPAPADPGRATSGEDRPAGATRLALIDLPAASDGATAPQLWLAAAGTEAGWRRAEASLSLDGGASWQPVGQTAPPAVMGNAVGVLAATTAALFDRASELEVDLLHDGMALQGADDAALVAGANFALVGDELVQFGAASQIAPRRFRLGRLVRGRRGTEWAMDGHAAGERFVLLDPGRLLALDVPVAAIGTEAQIMASGPGDGGVPATASIEVVGSALRPPPPVHLSARRLADNTIRFGWTRRSRAGWAWLDGIDAPLGEDAERYRLRITPSSGSPRTVETTASSYDYDSAAQAADGATGASSIALEIAQIGTRASSLPAAAGTWIL